MSTDLHSPIDIAAAGTSPTSGSSASPADRRSGRDGRAPHPRQPRWPMLLAVAVIAQPVVLGLNAAFHPAVEMDAASILTGAAEGPLRWYVVHLLAAFGALLGAPAAIGLRRMVHHRGTVLADTAVAAAFVGATALSMGFAIEASVVRLAADELGPGAALDLVDAYLAGPDLPLVGLGFLASVVAAALMGAALLRDGRAPRWVPALLLAGIAITVVVPPGGPVGPIGFGLAAIASAALVRALGVTPAARC